MRSLPSGTPRRPLARSLLGLVAATLAIVGGPSGTRAQGLLDELGTSDPWSRLERQDASTREAALAQVVRISDHRACDRLFAILANEPKGTGLRPLLLQAFGRLRCRGFLGYLEAQARRTNPPDESRAAVLALGRLRDPRSLPLLVALAATGQAVEPAVASLRRYGAPAIPALLGLARGRSRATPRAIDALLALRSPALGPLLREGLTSGALAPKLALPALCRLEGPRALPLVLPWLWHEDPSLRLAVLEALDRCADARAVPSLLAALAELPLRPAAIRLLGRLGVRAPESPLSSLLLAARKPVETGRLPFAHALGRIGGPASVPLLARLVERGGLAPEALDALQHTGSAQAARILRRIARRRDPLAPRAVLRVGSLLRSAGAARSALPSPLRREAEAALPELIAFTRGRDPALQTAALQALGRLGDARGLGALLAALRSPRAALRRAAAAGLGGIDDDRAVAALLGVVGKDKDLVVRAEAAWALGRHRSQLAAEPLVAALADPGLPVALHAAAALGRLGIRSLGRRLARALDHSDPHVRANVALALGRLRYAGAHARLLRAAEGDPSPLVRAAAGRALAARGGSAAKSDLQGLLDREVNERVCRILEEAVIGLDGRPPTRPPADPQERWLDLRLEAGSGKPVPYRAYLIHLPDGTVLHGVTDSDGNGVLEGTPPGITSLELLPYSLHPDAPAKKAGAELSRTLTRLGAELPEDPSRP